MPVPNFVGAGKRRRNSPIACGSVFRADLACRRRGTSIARARIRQEARMFDRKQIYLGVALLGLAEVVAVLVVAAVR